MCKRIQRRRLYGLYIKLKLELLYIEGNYRSIYKKSILTLVLLKYGTLGSYGTKGTYSLYGTLGIFRP